MDFAQMFITLTLILGIAIIYSRSDRTENLLLLKLVGYYLLGCFRFTFNNLAIPLGFIIYAIFLRPQMNSKSKRMAAVLGLVVFITGLAQPAIEKYLYELPIKVKAESTNLYDMDHRQDWQSVCQALELSEGVKLEDFYAGFGADGEIRELSYKLIAQNNKGIIYCNVSLDKQSREYIIHRSKIQHWSQYERLVSAERFFDVLSELDIERLKPEGDYDFYSLASQGERVNYGIRERDKFILVSKDDIQKVNDEDLPIDGYYLSIYGMYRLSEVTHEGRDFQEYFFDVKRKEQ